ncbi:trace amine-associated receptor 3 [Pseudochaenichthys georgianus]|uniref:trace amine-associated receptor 3 n=1 Tax=Pseudochaenichthys georgianus TaxID=52239 RepID=UPI00146E1510|nr:trace amine-associated receptor 3 [Pseudochaenichthys georgianus]
MDKGSLEMFEKANTSLQIELQSCATFRNQASRFFLYAFLSVGIMCTVVGNFLVVLSIAYFKQLQSPTNSFVMSLAVADCLVGLVVMPYSMIRTVEGCWYFGVLFCQLHSSLDVMLCTASIFHLSCIAYDRYYAVCNPLVYSLKMSHSRVALLIFVCWAVPMLISFCPIMLDLHVAGVDILIPEDVCVFLVNRIYAVMASLVAFYLPMAIMLIAYWKIFKAAKRQARQISAMESQMASGVGKDSSKKKRHRNTMKRERKAAKTLGIIMGVFLIFWMPFFTVNIVDPFIEYSTEVVVWDIFLWLGYINSSLNPFLYGFFNHSFRRAFLMFIGCRVCLPGSSPGMDLSHTRKDPNEHSEERTLSLLRPRRMIGQSRSPTPCFSWVQTVGSDPVWPRFPATQKCQERAATDVGFPTAPPLEPNLTALFWVKQASTVATRRTLLSSPGDQVVVRQTDRMHQCAFQASAARHHSLSHSTVRL